MKTPTIARALTALALTTALIGGSALAASADDLVSTDPAAVEAAPDTVAAPAPEQAPVAVPDVVAAPVAPEVEAPAADPAPAPVAPAAATSTKTTPKATKVLSWILPDGGTMENVTWPQPVDDKATVPCGVTVTIQHDTYPYGTAEEKARTDALDDDGVLSYGEDHGWAISWFFTTYTAPKCGPVTVIAPTIVVEGPTCDLDGYVPVWRDNPPAQNPNGRELPGLGSRVYFSGEPVLPGTYTATIQKIGPGFDPAFPNGTKVTGNTTQTIVILPATGYQSTDSEAPCYVEVPPTTEVTVWATGEYGCGDTEVTEAGVITTTTYALDPKTGLVSSTSVDTETQRVRPLEPAEIEALNCPVIVDPPVDPPVVVDPPVAVVAPPYVDRDFAVTGADALMPSLAALVLSLIGGAAIWIGRRGRLFA